MKNSLELIELSSINKVSLVQVFSCSNTGSIRNDPYRTSRKNNLELIDLSSINKISLAWVSFCSNTGSMLFSLPGPLSCRNKDFIPSTTNFFPNISKYWLVSSSLVLPDSFAPFRPSIQAYSLRFKDMSRRSRTPKAAVIRVER